MGQHAGIRAFASNIALPQSRVVSTGAAGRVEITGVSVRAIILEQVATTTMDISLRNPTRSRIDAEMLVPVPAGAVIKDLKFEGSSAEASAELLPKDKAISIYKSIVAKTLDPAMLEFAGNDLVRSSVFPVEPNGTQKIRLVYEHLLTADQDRVDYVLPRTEAIDYKVPWDVSVKITAKRPVTSVYCSSHTAITKGLGETAVTVNFTKETLAQPGPLQLSYLLAGKQAMSATLLAYPDPKVDGGYFLLLAGLPPRASDTAAGANKREITLVIDRSGSMGGEKIKQAKAAAALVIQSMEEGEAFNIIDYSDTVAKFANAPVVKDKKTLAAAAAYIDKITAAGSTDIQSALLEAIRIKPAEGMLPIVLFLSDGQPTAGERNEARIRETITKGNEHNRRIFSFGVGYDVNAPLLMALSNNSRATSTFVQPNEDVEAKVSQVYKRLVGPVLTEPKLAIIGPDGKVDTQRVRDVMPGRIPDLFDGDQLVLLGQYRGKEPLRFQISGQAGRQKRTFDFEFKLDKADVRNSFVPRLWASRRIAAMIEDIRLAGGEREIQPEEARKDPKMKEAIDEIVRLSIEHGILTEYTAFLAKDGVRLEDVEAMKATANENLISRTNTRSGAGGFNQAMNGTAQMSQTTQNRMNTFYNERMEQVEISTVQQVNDRAFFRQGKRWIDSNALGADRKKTELKPDSTVAVSSKEFSDLVDKLVKVNRQGVLAMPGEVLVNVDGKNILITPD